MTLQEIQYKAQGIIHKWRDDDSAPYIEFVEELAHMIVPEPSEDLEEAADEYEKKHTYQRYDGGGLTPEYNATLAEAVIFGAKWQKQRDAELIEIAYNDGITIGMTKQKEQMMQKAVEGEIRGDIRSQEEEPYQIWAESDFLPLDEKFEIGDKVRIIIVKEEEK